ncbi:hypothetical protein LCGC14_1675020 [marine sediment metagenome]|uniref:ParB-like N-terminal domain-containing protein n=1 Tax=marine sediment metagenome TaxID=412755 RepID=A0A0F9HQD3_9ZZZZ
MAKTVSPQGSRALEPGPNQTGMIDIRAIVIMDQAMRHDPEDDSIIELAQDIAQKGLLQPIGVRSGKDGNYQLLWGGRRLAAHKRLNKGKILATIWQDMTIPVKAIALVENLQRVNLSLVEEVEAVNYLHHHENKSPDQISTILSKGRSWVMRRLAIPQLPDELRVATLEGEVSVGVSEEIARVPHSGFRRFLLSQAISLRWTIVQTQGACRAYIEAIERGDPTPTEQELKDSNFTPSPLFLACAQCGGLKAEETLALIRVCLGGCNPTKSEGVDSAQVQKEDETNGA